MRRRLLAVLFAVPAVALVLDRGSPDPARGCAVAPPPGRPRRHLHRDGDHRLGRGGQDRALHPPASFTSTSAEFGFLVPTPTVPEAGRGRRPTGSANSSKATAPRTVDENRRPPSSAAG